jgi:tetratricopeptide (TPR) repeat protein
MGTWDYLSDGSSSATKLFSAITTAQSTYREAAATNLVSAGLTQYENGNYKAAAASLRLATAYAPDNTDAYNYLAKADLKLGKTKEAIAAYKNSLDADNTQGDTYVDLASIYIDQENYTEAEKVLKKGSQADPTNSLPIYTLGLLQLNNLDKPEEAVKAFKKTIRLSPNDGNAYYGLGAALNKEGNYDQAVTQLKKALSLNKDSAATMYELGNAYAALGKNDDAETMISKLEDLDTSAASTMASNLEITISQPKILSVDTDKSTFSTSLGSVSLLALDPSFVTPSATKTFSMTFKFDSEMDEDSVTNLANWTVGRSKGATAGLYDNGLYRVTDRGGTVVATKVTYNPTTHEATVYFPISQNSSGTGTIDTKHLTFTFKGTDANGKKIDSSADQYNGSVGEAF